MKNTKFYQKIGHISLFTLAFTSCGTSEQKPAATPVSPNKDTVAITTDTLKPTNFSTQDSAKKLKDSIEKMIEETPLDISVDSFLK